MKNVNAWLIVIILVLAGALIYFYVQGEKADAAAVAAKVETEKAKQEKMDADKAWLAQLQKSEIEKAYEKQLREGLDEKLVQSEIDKAVLKDKLKIALGAIATMPSDTLLGEINARIQNQASLRVGDLFEFTRRGAEFTLAHFKTGEFNLALYTQSEVDKKTLGEKVGSLERSLVTAGTDYTSLYQSKLKDENLITKQDGEIKVLETGKKKDRWKGRAEGALVTLIIQLGLSLFGK